MSRDLCDVAVCIASLCLLTAVVAAFLHFAPDESVRVFKAMLGVR